MKILLDTNIILDVLLKREPFLEKSAFILLLSEKKLIDGYVTASGNLTGSRCRKLLY